MQLLIYWEGKIYSYSKMAFPHSRAKKVVFTKNIKKIEEGALGGKKIKNIVVPEGSIEKYQKWYKKTADQASVDWFGYQNLPV